jgi:hypothetical protein
MFKAAFSNEISPRSSWEIVSSELDEMPGLQQVFELKAESKSKEFFKLFRDELQSSC